MSLPWSFDIYTLYFLVTFHPYGILHSGKIGNELEISL